MAIPRFQQWKALTKEGMLERRGSNIVVIDGFLEAYWAAVDCHRSQRDQAAALICLVKSCNSWLKRKAGKSEKKKTLGLTGLKEVDRDLFKKRKTAIMNLARDAMAEFQNLLPHVTGADQKYLKARSTYESHRFNALTGPQNTSTKTMDSAYQPERELWLKSGKTSNVAGSMVHPTHAALHRGDHNDKLDKNIQWIMQKDASTLTPGDWVEIQQFCIKHQIDSSNTNNSQCRYLKVAERMAALLYVNGNGLFEDYDGQPITVWGGGTPIYVMDRYGNFYTDSNRDIKWGGKFINHSSILSGNEVVCAGNVDIQNGQLMQINNNSGHYKPSKDNLMECVRSLAAENADLSRTVVEVFRFQGVNTYVDTWNAAGNFLSNNAPDSTRQRH